MAAQMTPAEYLTEIVTPTVQECLARPEDRRRAYLACIATFHLCDYLGAQEGLKGFEVARGMRKALSGDPIRRIAFEIVEGVCIGAKHCKTIGGRDGRLEFNSGSEKLAPQFEFDNLSAGFDWALWDGSGLVVEHDGHGLPLDLAIVATLRAFEQCFGSQLAGATWPVAPPGWSPLLGRVVRKPSPSQNVGQI